MDTHLMTWLVAASLVAMLMMRRSKKELGDTPPEALEPHRGIRLEVKLESLESLYKALQEEGLAPYYHRLDWQKIIVDDAKIGAFHWGFLYIIALDEAGSLHVGLYAKGLNPPKGKRLAPYLDALCERIVRLVSPK